MLRFVYSISASTFLFIWLSDCCSKKNVLKYECPFPVKFVSYWQLVVLKARWVLKAFAPMKSLHLTLFHTFLAYKKVNTKFYLFTSSRTVFQTYVLSQIRVKYAIKVHSPYPNIFKNLLKNLQIAQWHKLGPLSHK